VRFNPRNVIGCPNSASAFSDCTPAACAAAPGQCCPTDGGSCNSQIHNFVSHASDGRNMFGYDYFSVMHYGPKGFSKNDGLTMTLLDGGTLVPLPTIGSLDLGSQGKVTAKDWKMLRAMYPSPYQAGVIFEFTGMNRICGLEGREQDLATIHGVEIALPPAELAHLRTTGEVDADRLATQFESVVCIASSNFGAGTYDYPNTTVAFSSPAQEEYYYSAPNIVLSPGLIPILFGP
jgi:hypothetical protein